MRNHKPTVLVWLLMIFSMLLAACGGSAPSAPEIEQVVSTAASVVDSGTAATSAPAPAAATAETSGASSATGATVPLEVTMSANTNVPDPADNFVKQQIDEALNTDLSLVPIASSDEYWNQLSVRLAGGNYPDLFMVDRTHMVDFAQKGLLLDLSAYQDKLQPTLSAVGEDSASKGTFDGKLFAVAKRPQIPYTTYWLRKDWLDKLGLQAPTNVDELLNVATAFTQQDPDGNGKADTYGLIGNADGLAIFQPILGAYGVGAPGTFYMKDGKLVNSYDDPAMKDALGFIAKLSQAGVVDPEWASTTGTQHRDKAIQGLGGIVFIDWPQITKVEYIEQIKTVNPNAEWIQLPAIEGPAGASAGTWDIGTAPGMFAMPRTLEQQPEKLQKAIDLLNYVAEGDGLQLVEYGVKGRHFNVEGDKVVPTDLMATEANYTWVYQLTGRPELQYLQTKFASQAEYIEFAQQQPRIEVLNGFLTPPAGYNPADVDRFTTEQMINFIKGARPLSEYDAFLEELNTTFNYQTYRDAAQQQLTELGLVK